MSPIHSNSTCINYVLFHRKALILAASGMETAKTNMMGQLPSEILVKIWLLKHGQTGGGSGQTGGGVSGGYPEKMCEENFYRNGLNLFSMHRWFQLYPILHAQIFFWLWKWPSKLKSHFFRGSFSRLTFQVRRGPCLVFCCQHPLHPSPMLKRECICVRWGLIPRGPKRQGFTERKDLLASSFCFSTCCSSKSLLALSKSTYLK